MTDTGSMSVEDAAAELVGNWKNFESFAWHRKYDLDDPETWCVIYTHNRDSGLLDQSNADAISKALEPYTDGDDPDVVFESHGHWAVGHVDGASIRVYRDGEITAAFKTYNELAERLADYPVLDEADYSEKEYQATLANIADAAYRLKHEYELPDGWESEVFSWFWDHNQRAVENRDDQGGYPSQDELKVAFEALEYEPVDE